MKFQLLTTHCGLRSNWVYPTVYLILLNTQKPSRFIFMNELLTPFEWVDLLWFGQILCLCLISKPCVKSEQWPRVPFCLRKSFKKLFNAVFHQFKLNITYGGLQSLHTAWRSIEHTPAWCVMMFNNRVNLSMVFVTINFSSGETPNSVVAHPSQKPLEPRMWAWSFGRL